jgi:hypothetical protein
LEKVKEDNDSINLQINAVVAAARNSRKYARVKDAPRAKMKVAHVSLQSCIDGIRTAVCVGVCAREEERKTKQQRKQKYFLFSLSRA